MNGNIECSAVIFADFDDLKMENAILMDLLNETKEYEFIPNVINELNISGGNAGMPYTNRIQLISKKMHLAVNIVRHEIRIDALPTEDDENKLVAINLDEFQKNILEIFKIMLKFKKERKGTRISLISTVLQENNEKNGYEKFCVPKKIYEGKDIFEWSLRNVFRRELEIVGEKENLNFCSQVFKNESMMVDNLNANLQENVNGVIFQFDINTVPENNLTRVDYAFAKEFYEKIFREIKVLEEGFLND